MTTFPEPVLNGVLPTWRRCTPDSIACTTPLVADPFDPDGFSLDLIIEDPDGCTIRVPAWADGIVEGRQLWRISWNPQRAGSHRWRWAWKIGGSEQLGAWSACSVEAGDGPGFLTIDGHWCFWDGERPWRGLGLNVCWEPRTMEDPSNTYDVVLAALAEAGGNFFRTWMCVWNLPLDWQRVATTDRYQDTPERFHPQAAQRFDELVILCRRLGLRFMLTLDWHGALMSGDKWSHNSFNRVNGGPVDTPAEFFTDPRAKARYRARLRTLVARWGAYPEVAVWEFFNEIDHVVWGEKLDHAAVAAWHAEMAQYLKRIDPYQRPVTTSVSHRDIQGMDSAPDLDFAQRHIYIHTSHIPAAISAYSQALGKPYVIGECGFEWDWTKDFALIADEMDFDFRRAVWYGLFAPTPILPMSWWWEFFLQRGMYAWLRGVRQVLDRMLAAGDGQFEPLPVLVFGLEVFAMRCGQSTFVWVCNSSTERQQDTLYLPASTATRLVAYETRGGEPLAQTPAWQGFDGAARIELDVPARGDIVLELN